MFSFALKRHFNPCVGPSWRSLQWVLCGSSCMVKRECFYTSSNPLLAPQVYMATSLLFPRLASSRLLRLRPLSFSASLLCQSHPVPTAPGRRQENQQRLSMKALAYAPKPALYLGFSGLLPFLGAPLLMAVTQSYLPEVAYAQVVYGASIVSFLGGARWGFALPEGSPAQPDWMNLGNSVVPSLLAWLALLCRDNITEGALVVIMGLGLALHYDLTLLPGYPGWFKAMRTILTLVATFSLVATLTLQKMCPEKKIKAQEN
ncbi:transmembrane protein 69 [Salmo trutta]|uniref:Transmembrane protein 69 n=1 Tax=Salmo trutta TaxID=8032 RepID=A0A673Z3R4_SALTR|nr:transmembrane protein 69-like [Salmo trutta]